MRHLGGCFHELGMSWTQTEFDFCPFRSAVLRPLLRFSTLDSSKRDLRVASDESSTSGDATSLPLMTPIMVLQTSAHQLQNLCGSAPDGGDRRCPRDQEKWLGIIQAINPSDIFVYPCNLI